MMRRSLRAGLLASFLGCSISALATAQEKPHDLPRESWAIMSFSGSDAGYTHVQRELTLADGGETEQIHSVESTEMKIGRLGVVVEIKMTVETWESVDGALVRQRSVSKMSANETVAEAVFRDGKAFITTERVGKARTKELPCPPEALGSYALTRRIERELGNTGKSFEVLVWSTDVSKAIPTKLTIGSEEEIEHGGAKVRAIRVDSAPKGLPSSTSWVSKDGRDLRTEVSIAGITMIARDGTKEEALAAVAKGANLSPDLFTPSMVVEPHFLPAPRRAERAIVKVLPRDGAKLDVLEDDRQRALGHEASGAFLLELRTVTPPPGLRGKRPLAGEDAALPAEVRDALTANSMIESDAPEIAKVADEVVGAEPEAWRAAQMLEMWVEENLTDKRMDVAFASALEVCRDRSGDCSEHAVFLCALCRAAGIPSRVAMGLLYIGGIWGGHAWNEVWIDGHWYALDATLGLGRCDALHLAFSKMTLKEGGFAEEFAGLLANLGKLDLEVLEMSLARWVEPKRDQGRVEDGWYRDDAWGIRFRLPEGAKTEVFVPKAAIGFDLFNMTAELGEDGLRLQLRGYDAGGDGGWPSFLGEPKGTELTIDGRPALRVGDGGLRRVLVRSGAKVFELKFTRVKAGASEAAYDALLSSIDFDLD